MNKTSFLGRELDHPIMNAAGTCKRLEDVIELAKSPVAAIMVGSITKKHREGNPGNVWEYCGGYSLNSLGLPNPGFDYYKRTIPEMKKIASDAGKLLFVSVAGFSPDEYAEGSLMAMEAGADFVEENLGCPNVWGDDGQKPIASFSRNLSHEIISKVGGEIRPFGVKLSPYSNPLELADMAGMLNGWIVSGYVGFVTTSNTFPNAYACREDGQQLIAVGKGLAGFAGPGMKPIALGQVIQFHGLLEGRVELVGAGGVASGQDVVDFTSHGAKLVQVGSEFARSHDPKVFGRILQEYVDLTAPGDTG